MKYFKHYEVEKQNYSHPLTSKNEENVVSKEEKQNSLKIRKALGNFKF